MCHSVALGTVPWHDPKHNETPHARLAPHHGIPCWGQPRSLGQRPQEMGFCTDAPRTQWIPEAEARERFGASRYVLVKYKLPKGNCHEFYAVDAQGTVVETYMHPVTGETVRTTRIPAAASPATPPRAPQ